MDHILPQSYIKDDSIDNKALVLREQNQRKKDNLLLTDKIIDDRKEWWKCLLESGLITQTKYYRLIRRKMFETDGDREKFVKRQLVETRQITKYATNLLRNEYENANIYAIRAELTHNFREKYELYKNRNINNFHHAQDAYILSIIGNVMDKYWKHNEKFKYGEYVKNYLKSDISKYEKNGMIMGLINKYINVTNIKKVMSYNDYFISRMLEEGTGEFYKQTLYSPKDKPVIPLKNNLSVEKYGGYSGKNIAYCVIYSYIYNNKQEYQLTGIPIQVAYEIKLGKTSVEKYIISSKLQEINYTELKDIKNKILINQEYLDENNEPMRLCSDSEIRTDKELIVNEKMSELIYVMNLDERKLNDKQKVKKEDIAAQYSYMFDYLLEKLKKEYKIFAGTYDRLISKYEVFEKLEEKDKKSVINGLIDLMQTGQGNLTAIGLTAREGRKSGQNFNTKKLFNIIFIDKSVTGMYERRYKINGMENCCSK